MIPNLVRNVSDFIVDVHAIINSTAAIHLYDCNTEEMIFTDFLFHTIHSPQECFETGHLVKIKAVHPQRISHRHLSQQDRLKSENDWSDLPWCILKKNSFYRGQKQKNTFFPSYVLLSLCGEHFIRSEMLPDVKSWVCDISHFKYTCMVCRRANTM